MRTITSFADGVVILPAFLNTLQTRIAGVEQADSNNHYSALVDGADVRIWSYPTGLATGAAPLLVDGSIDWRDRHVLAAYIDTTAATRGAGQADDYQQSGFVPAMSFGYTGLGGKDSGGATPTAGNPPVLATGKYLITLATTGSGALAYANTSTGKLYYYNNTGGTAYPTIVLVAFGDTGKR